MFTQISELAFTPNEIVEAQIMTITAIKENDIVKCDVRGQVFFALVTGIVDNPDGKGKMLTVAPITPNVTYYSVKPRQVTSHWRKRKG